MSKSKYKNLVANTTVNDANSLVFTTARGSTGFSLIVTADSSLGGGTLNVCARADGTTMTPEPLNDGADAPSTDLAAGDQGIYSVGGDMQIFVTLSGATAPDVKMVFAEV
jgi:hypothetical protein